ncbi:retinol dehydrogenase 12-like isoform X2 [Halichondria panicea]
MGTNLSVPEVDQSGKVAIVTGGNTGIGYELVKGLAEMGATTIMASRSEERAMAAIAKIKESSDKDLKIEFMHLDLASFQATKDFVRAFKEKNLPLHILINNAAVAAVPFSRTDDGMEMQYQVNHLSPFLLTLELLPTVIETASSSGDGRILFVSSVAHVRGWAGTVNFDTINSEQDYGRFNAYGRSKLYNVMTTFALQRRLQDVNITVSAQHPGLVKTELSRGTSDKVVMTALFKPMEMIFARTPVKGASTTLNCAINPALNSQTAHYYSSCRETQCSPDARNVEYQEELWRRSVEGLRDHLSPEILDMYGSTLPIEQPTTVATEQPTTVATTVEQITTDPKATANAE